jgi:hypothetical protein
LAFYNARPPHTALGGRTPDEAYAAISAAGPAESKKADKEEELLAA